ncbi:MAG: hypothetical protein ACI841_004350 [Planctomycetota bacterium]
MTDSSVDDVSTGIGIIKTVKGRGSSVTGDAGYDTVAMLDTANIRGARVVLRPSRSAALSLRRPRSAVCDRTIKRVNWLGRRRRKKESDYHRQGTVENAFTRYKSMRGDRLHVLNRREQMVEVAIGCQVLNTTLALGRPKSVA